MIFIKFNLLSCILFVNILRTGWASQEQYECLERENCIDKSITHANLFKADHAKFEKCPSTQLCYDAESRIRLHETSGLFLESESSLKLLGNSSIELDGNTFFRLQFNCFLMNRGNIIVNSAEIFINSKSQLLNDGEIILQNNSKTEILDFSEMQLYENARLLQETESSLTLYQHSWLHLKQDLCIMKKARLELKFGSSIIQFGGKIVMNEGSKLVITEAGSVHSNGILHLSKNSDVYIKGRLLIGTVTGKNKNEQENSSLIFIKNGIRLSIYKNRQLLIVEGAHCLLKKSFYEVDFSEKEINSSTKNEYFDCYPNREDLTVALTSWNITIPISY